MATDQDNPSPEPFNEGSSDQEIGNGFWLFILPISIAPLWLAYSDPITGIYLIDFLVHGAPLIIAIALMLLLFRFGGSIIARFTNAKTDNLTLIHIVILSILSIPCVMISIAVSDYIRQDAIAFFGSAEDKAEDSPQ